MKHQENYNGFKKTAKLIADIVSWTILTILVVIAAFLLYYFVANKIYASKGEQFSPAIGLYTIVSPSMEPNLRVYDVIIDKKVNSPNEIKVGDIITFISTSTISKGLTITHRVVALVETENGIEYKTKGDNNMSPDSTTVQFKNILGKVVIKVPQLGRVQQFLSTSSGWLLVVVIPAVLIIFNDILKIFKLTGAKKKVTNALQTEEQKEQKEIAKKEEIKVELKRRYNVERELSEPDPLPTNCKLTKVLKENKKVEITPPMFELPKLKNVEEELPNPSVNQDYDNSKKKIKKGKSKKKC
ncbi:MAG: signal peptidase I [Bacilli bacterium]|nr:signal peptidase I [Bacilli bacterium]